MQKIYKLYAGALAVVLLTGAGVAFQQVRHTRALFHGLSELQAQINLQNENQSRVLSERLAPVETSVTQISVRLTQLDERLGSASV